MRTMWRSFFCRAEGTEPAAAEPVPEPAAVEEAPAPVEAAAPVEEAPAAPAAAPEPEPEPVVMREVRARCRSHRLERMPGRITICLVDITRLKGDCVWWLCCSIKPLRSLSWLLFILLAYERCCMLKGVKWRELGCLACVAPGSGGCAGWPAAAAADGAQQTQHLQDARLGRMDLVMLNLAMQHFNSL